MSPVLRAELRKLRRTRSLWAVPVVAAALSTIGATLLISLMKTADLADRLSEHGPLRFGPTNTGLVLLVFGIRVFADETQHRTLASTYVAAPRRRRVLLAKLAVAAGVAVAYCFAVFALVVPITLVGIHARHVPMTADLGATAALLARTAFAMAITAAIGVAVAAIGRNRALVLVASLAWLALVEDVTGALLKIPELLPGAVVSAVVSGTGGPDSRRAPGAGALLLAFGVAATVAAMSRLGDDVT
jgi:ABC-type transport system involved in multi-copper enzyme maturation permease subunit